MTTTNLPMVDDTSPNKVSQINMTQPCKVCSEPAAGFHFGAFTCEGCKSFFGRTYNNLTSLNECKNDGQCVINKKTRTSCKSCRLRKCFFVGMSKSGSRYGRRSNWFKIHYLMNNQKEENLRSSSAFTNYPSPNRDHRSSISPIEERSKSVPIKSPPYVSPSSLSKFKDSTSDHLSLLSHINQQPSLPKESPQSPKSTSPKTSPDMPYPMDVLALYNQLPLMAHAGLNPFLNPAAIAQGLITPYYPSLLSLYCQSQNLGSLHGKRSLPETSSSNHEDLEDLERPLKIRRTSESPVLSKWTPKLPPTPPMVDIFQTPPPARERSVKTESPDIPIDLRIRTKVFEMDSSVSSPLSESETSSGRISIKSEVDSPSQVRPDQQCPLDLSSLKS